MQAAEQKDRVTVAKESAAELIAWYDGRALPTLPVKLNKHTTLINAKKYVETQIATMQAYKPLSMCWNHAYMRLHNLKIFLSK